MNLDVSDGTKNGSYVETDHPNPLSIYGKSKYKGELAIQETIGTYAIIRTSWLYGQYKKNFVTTMLDMGNRNHSVSVVTDQFGTSTYTADLSYAIWIIISKNLQGIYHVANTGTCSRYEWAKKIFELTGDQVSVYPVKTEDYKRARVICFDIGSVLCAVEYVISANMDNLCTCFFSRNCNIFCARGVDSKGLCYVCFACIHIRESGAVNNNVWPLLSYESGRIRALCNIHLCMICTNHSDRRNCCKGEAGQPADQVSAEHAL